MDLLARLCVGALRKLFTFFAGSTAGRYEETAGGAYQGRRLSHSQGIPVPDCLAPRPHLGRLSLHLECLALSQTALSAAKVVLAVLDGRSSPHHGAGTWRWLAVLRLAVYR